MQQTAVWTDVVVPSPGFVSHGTAPREIFSEEEKLPCCVRKKVEGSSVPVWRKSVP